MKKLITFLLLTVILANAAIADCNVKTDIVPGPNKTYIYSEGCHLMVGQLVQDAKVKDAQIADLTKAISLKDLAITNADARVALWQTTAEKEQDRMNTLSSEKNHDNWIYFGLGIMATIGAGYAASQVYRH